MLRRLLPAFSGRPLVGAGLMQRAVAPAPVALQSRAITTTPDGSRITAYSVRLRVRANHLEPGTPLDGTRGLGRRFNFDSRKHFKNLWYTHRHMRMFYEMRLYKHFKAQYQRSNRNYHKVTSALESYPATLSFRARISPSIDSARKLYKKKALKIILPPGTRKRSIWE